jgi:ribosomal protein S18 acetylase RimI-like enzyme
MRKAEEIEINYAEVKDLKTVLKMMGYVPTMEVPDYDVLLSCYLQKRYPDILVAFLDDKKTPVGIAIFSTYPTHMGAHDAFLFCLSVEPEHRRKGIGRALLEKLKEIMQKRGTDYLCFYVHQENTDALKFYKEIGAIVPSGDFMNCALYTKKEEVRRCV